MLQCMLTAPAVPALFMLVLRHNARLHAVTAQPLPVHHMSDPDWAGRRVHCVSQETDASKRRKLVDSMCRLEERLQRAVTALHITAAKLLLALGTHIVIPKPQGDAARQRGGVRRLALSKFIERLTNVSDTAHVTPA